MGCPSREQVDGVSQPHVHQTRQGRAGRAAAKAVTQESATDGPVQAARGMVPALPIGDAGVHRGPVEFSGWIT